MIDSDLDPARLVQYECALREHDRMRILASECVQLGFLELARFLDDNAAGAMKWACAVVQPVRPGGRTSKHF